MMNVDFCEMRLCPDCGMEIRCESGDGELMYFFVEDRPVACCPECGRDLSYDNLRPAPEKQEESGNTSRRPSISKAELVSEIKEENEFFQSKADSERALNSVSEVLFRNLTQGKNIIWSDVGRFKLVTHKARKGRHPRTGAEITIPSRVTVRFNPGKKLRDALNGKEPV